MIGPRIKRKTRSRALKRDPALGNSLLPPSLGMVESLDEGLGARGKIAADHDQLIDEGVAGGGGEAGERLLPRRERDHAHFLHDGLCLLGHEEEARTAIAAMSTPLYKPRLFKPIDMAAQGDRLNLEDLGEPGLMDPFMPREMDQHLPLRPAEPQPSRLLIEFLPQQPRNIMQQEAEAPFR